MWVATMLLHCRENSDIEMIFILVNFTYDEQSIEAALVHLKGTTTMHIWYDTGTISTN